MLSLHRACGRIGETGFLLSSIVFKDCPIKLIRHLLGLNGVCVCEL